VSLLKSWSDHRALRAARRSADDQLLASLLPSPLLAWRIAELTSPEHRDELARAFADAVHAADERFLPNARPLNRGAVREARAQLLELAACLFDGERSISARAVLLAERLLSDGASPLYGNDSAHTLCLRIKEIREALGS
jgi:hypothetical protein